MRGLPRRAPAKRPSAAMVHELGGTRTVAPHPLVKREESTTKLSVQARFRTGARGRREPGARLLRHSVDRERWDGSGSTGALARGAKGRKLRLVRAIVVAPSPFGTVLHRIQRLRRAPGPVTLAGHAWHDREGRGGRRPLLPDAPSARQVRQERHGSARPRQAGLRVEIPVAGVRVLHGTIVPEVPGAAECSGTAAESIALLGAPITDIAAPRRLTSHSGGVPLPRQAAPATESRKEPATVISFR